MELCSSTAYGGSKRRPQQTPNPRPLERVPCHRQAGHTVHQGWADALVNDLMVTCCRFAGRQPIYCQSHRAAEVMEVGLQLRQ